MEPTCWRTRRPKQQHSSVLHCVHKNSRFFQNNWTPFALVWDSDFLFLRSQTIHSFSCAAWFYKVFVHSSCDAQYNISLQLWTVFCHVVPALFRQCSWQPKIFGSICRPIASGDISLIRPNNRCSSDSESLQQDIPHLYTLFGQDTTPDWICAKYKCIHSRITV